MSLPKLGYTPEEVAQATGVHIQKVRAAIGCGLLPAKRQDEGSRRYLVLERDVRAWLEAMPDA